MIRRRLLDHFFYPGGGWVRVLGFGVCWKDTTRVPLSCSERLGFVGRLQLGRWCVRFLPRVIR